MVDAAASVKNGIEVAVVERSATAVQTAEAFRLLDHAAYKAFAGNKVFAPAQSPAWISAWMRHSGLDCFILLVGNDQDAQIALPLEVLRFGPVKAARLMGNRHANGNFPAANTRPGSFDPARIIAAMKALRPDIDLLLLERMAHVVGGATNPLAHLNQQQSPNIALAVSLDGGFDAMLSRTSGKRKRKKHRSQTRKFEAVGEIRRIEANTPEDVNRILDTFFELKAIRFKEFGLPDVFADAETRSFFRALFLSALEKTPKPFSLQALEVAGKLRAITGSSISADRLICEFGAIADDDLGHASPGEFLFFDNIRDASERGFAVYDFSVGDERYKRLWCDLEETQFDVRLPISFNGRLLAASLRAAASTKRAIKSNPLLWSVIKKFRRSKASSAPENSNDE